MWGDPDLAPWLGHALLEAGYQVGDSQGVESSLDEDDYATGWSPRDLADLLGIRSIDEALHTYYTVGNTEPQGAIPARLTLELLAEQALDDMGAPKGPRLVHISKGRAFQFVGHYHSKLDDANYRGLLFALGIAYGTRIAAVALINTPSGAFGNSRPGCPFDGIVELTRIASDASVKGASSMLASRVIDLLPLLGRRGKPGCLFVTYSLPTEAGTTYLALADKGLRPVALTSVKQAASGARKGGSLAHSLATTRKIVWQAGPAADAPDWTLLAGLAPDNQLEGARKAFALYGMRQARGGLFATRSRASETAAPYLALAAAGLRPVGLIDPAKDPAGARLDPRTVMWEAGAGAAPAAWSVLAGRAPEAELDAARVAFAGYTQRAARAPQAARR